MTTTILGLSAFYHDSAACLLRDGEIVAAAQEERFSREKHDADFPARAAAYCLREAGLESARQLDYVVFYEKPIPKFHRLLETYLTFAPAGIRSFLKAMPQWLKTKLKIREVIRRELAWDGPLLFTEHHESHAASAFFPSPFERAAIVTTDGVGERATASIGCGEGNAIQILKELHFPHSLGLLYSAFTYYTGFKVNSGEYKLMGLAPYGEPKHVDRILDELVDLREDGSLRLNLEHFDYCAGLKMTNRSFARLFGRAERRPESELTQLDMDLARSIQAVTEEAMLRLVRHAHELTGEKNLVLAGGVALNCVANGRILREGPFEGLWIQPAAGDAGGSLGAALFVHHQLLGAPRTADGVHDRQRASLLGPAFSEQEIGRFLTERGIEATRLAGTEELVDRVSDLLAAGKVVGWFQGRMEFGPRALGSRSILGDPRDPEMQATLNLKIKFRESFRPFAPAVLLEHAAGCFDLDVASPYMLLVCQVGETQRIPNADQTAHGLERLKVVRSKLPAVTHVDDSARVQTVASEEQPLLYALLERFHAKTGCPLLVNTSFNVRGEPIVCTPAEAYHCFAHTHMDAVALGPYLVESKKQATPVDWDPSGNRSQGESPTAESREPRRFGLILGGVLLILAILSWVFEHPVRAAVLGVLAAGVAGLALLLPGLWAPIHRLWMKAAEALGRGLSATVLGLFFYLVVTPVGLLQRLLVRAPLDASWKRRRASYWLAKKPGLFTLERYRRQH